MLRPGFEPGSPARKAGILDRSILPERIVPAIYHKSLGGISASALNNFTFLENNA